MHKVNSSYRSPLRPAVKLVKLHQYFIFNLATKQELVIKAMLCPPYCGHVVGVEMTPVWAGWLMNFSFPHDKHNLVLKF